ISEWKSDVTLAVAGFNYGDFRRKSQKIPKTDFEIEALANDTMPDVLRSIVNDAETVGSSWTPSALMDHAIGEAGAAVQVLYLFLVPTPVIRLANTQLTAILIIQTLPL